MKLLFLDTETTGTDKSKHCIHQISGAIVLEEFDENNNVRKFVKEVFDIKFRPKENAEIDEAALETCNITKEELFARELSYEDGYKTFLNILDKYINKYNKNDKFFLAGYNVHFDKDFLYGLFTDNNNNYLFSYIWGNHIDVMVLATSVLMYVRHQMENFKQGTVAKYVGFDIDESKLHDALFDIYVCIGLYCYFTKDKIESIDTFFNTSIKTPPIDDFKNPLQNNILNSLENIFTFGKYKNQKIGTVLEENPKYIIWMYEKCANQNIITPEIYNLTLQKIGNIPI